MRRHIGYHDFYSTVIGNPFICHCEPLPIVIASGAWQSRRGTRLLRRPSTDGLPRNDGRGSLRAPFYCHCEPFTSCHSERSEESQEAQDRLREAISGNSNGKNAK